MGARVKDLKLSTTFTLDATGHERKRYASSLIVAVQRDTGISDIFNCNFWSG